MSYQLKLSRRSLKSARFISKLHSAIQNALVESGKTQQQVAQELGVDRSVVNRRLKGNANLTARSIADFAYVLGKEIEVRFVDPVAAKGLNWVVTASTKTTKVQPPGFAVVGTATALPVEFESAEA
jgi:transcriptional regulator with XRE-family HTH domain